MQRIFKDKSRKELLESDGQISIFSDGSFGNKSQKIGVGFGVETPKGLSLQSAQYDCQIGIDGNRQNIWAEFKAAIHALKLAHELYGPGQDILIHTDLGDIIATIQAGRPHDYLHQSLHLVAEELLQVAGMHDDVKVIYACDKPHYHNEKIRMDMMDVHNMAAIASGASTFKTTSNLQMPNRHEDSSGFFDPIPANDDPDNLLVCDLGC